MSAVVKVSVTPSGTVLVAAREVRAIDTPTSIIEIDTCGVFAAASIVKPGCELECIHGLTIVQETKL